jgi:hypothetical protein
LLLQRGAANAAPETLEEERRMWIALAARSLQQAGEKELAVQLWMAMGHFKQARQLLETMGDPACLADCCTVAAAVLRAQGQAERGIPWLAEAVKQYKNLKQYTRCFELLDQEPALVKVRPTTSDCLPLPEQTTNFPVLSARLR